MEFKSKLDFYSCRNNHAFNRSLNFRERVEDNAKLRMNACSEQTFIFKLLAMHILRDQITIKNSCSLKVETIQLVLLFQNKFFIEQHQLIILRTLPENNSIYIVFLKTTDFLIFTEKANVCNLPCDITLRCSGQASAWQSATLLSSTDKL